jgi:hypothetical protein
MKKLLLLMGLGYAGISVATTYQPNTSNFTCPDGEIINTAKPINVSVGERPGGIGECFWKDPVTSFSLSDDLTSITAYTTWSLDGGWLADGCSDVKGEKLTSIGIVAKLQCKTQQK